MARWADRSNVRSGLAADRGEGARGILRLSCSVAQSTWRFMGSYKWGYKSLNRVIIIVALLITLLITTHEPPSKGVHRPA